MNEHFECHLHTIDGLELFTQGWKTETEPKGVICLVHGLGEHSSRYAHLADVLVKAGYPLLTFDLRGHGRSGGKRGHIPSYQIFLDDVKLLLGEAKKRYPHAPKFLYGHSMGGGLVLNYALRRQTPLAGVIATGPALRLGFEPPAIQVALAKLMDSIWPAFTQPSDLDTKALSRDPEVVRRYEEDPLVHDRVSARSFSGFYQAGLWALEHAEEFSVPLLLMHGSEDRLTSPGASQTFADRVGQGCTFKRWEGLYHEIHNEPEQQQVFDFLLRWLQQTKEEAI